MKILSVNKIQVSRSIAHIGYGILFFITLWFALPMLIQWCSEAAGMIDGSIWMLLLFAIISFTSLAFLSGWLLRYSLSRLGLPKIQLIISQFKTLTLWQQFAFYWASFALLLLAAVMSLIAVF